MTPLRAALAPETDLLFLAGPRALPARQVAAPPPPPPARSSAELHMVLPYFVPDVGGERPDPPMPPPYTPRSSWMPTTWGCTWPPPRGQVPMHVVREVAGEPSGHAAMKGYALRFPEDRSVRARTTRGMLRRLT